MKARLVRTLGIVLVVGMFAGSVNSFAAETDILGNQNIERLETSEAGDNGEINGSVGDEISVDEKEGNGRESFEDSIDESGESGASGLGGNIASPDGNSENETEEIEEDISASNEDETEVESSNVDDEKNHLSVDSAFGVETGDTEEVKPDDSTENEAENVMSDQDSEDYSNNEYYYEPITGVMIKGPWVLPDGRKVFYDIVTGQMVKGDYEVNGEKYHFDETDGHMLESTEDSRFWLTIDGNTYLYENWERQGWKPDTPDYFGEEVYDSETDAWYWLDGLNQGKMAVNMEVYQEVQTDDAERIGKWIRYGENGQRIRGWTEDGKYYYDPVYGTRAQGTVAIDGVAYEFNPDTGERIRKLGFENYGIVCNVAADTPYTYKAATCSDSSITTEGTAVFAYNTFYSNDTHPEKEGYIWKQVVITLTFDDVNAHVYGCRTNTLFGLDYYTFGNSVIEEPSSESKIEKEMTVLFNNLEYPIAVRHEVLRSEWGDDCAYHMDICIECHVPADYDGMVIALYHAGNVETGNNEMDLLDEDSLIFRME